MKTSRRALLGAIGLAGLSGTALTGCFGDSDSTGSSSSGSERIRIACLSAPRSSLSPFSDDAYKLIAWSAAECLTVLDEEGTPQPNLATSWEQRSDTEWVFTLRDGVSFHDGTAFTAETAANSLTRAAEASPLPRVLTGVGLSASAEDGRLVVTTASPDPLLPNRMSSPSLCLLATAAYGADATDPIGYGTGAFMIAGLNGNASASLDRYEDYWGEKALLAGIDATFVPDGTARASALRTGEADIAEAVPIGQLGGIDEELIHEVRTSRTTSLYLNTASGPFADPAVRAAARAAIDARTLIDKVFEGHADLPEGLFGPALGWAAQARGRVGFDDLLSSRAGAATDLNGQAVTLATYSDRSELPELAVQVQQMLESAGFTVTQDVREYQYMNKEILDGGFDAVILSRAMTIDTGDPVSTLASDFGTEGSFNIPLLKDSAVDQLIAAAGVIEPGEDRQDAIARAEAGVLARDAVIPLLHERSLQGEGSGVAECARDPQERLLVTSRTNVTR
ncbi:MAG: ABC transporter substrate-binding protein [Propionibacteriaceae bacterium]|nr:ABC transporter substrate-binding protein [Propionibacteriaceae bacterium]